VSDELIRSVHRERGPISPITHATIYVLTRPALDVALKSQQCGHDHSLLVWTLDVHRRSQTRHFTLSPKVFVSRVLPRMRARKAIMRTVLVLSKCIHVRAQTSHSSRPRQPPGAIYRSTRKRMHSSELLWHQNIEVNGADTNVLSHINSWKTMSP